MVYLLIAIGLFLETGDIIKVKASRTKQTIQKTARKVSLTDCNAWPISNDYFMIRQEAHYGHDQNAEETDTNSARDWARLGQLCLQDGYWHGQPLMSVCRVILTGCLYFHGGYNRFELSVLYRVPIGMQHTYAHPG
jgi:hypothetical protein